MVTANDQIKEIGIEISFNYFKMNKERAFCALFLGFNEAISRTNDPKMSFAHVVRSRGGGLQDTQNEYFIPK